eukprot:scaffold82788_cov15-Tisochrysis_lutea.AAC.1
MILVGPPGSGRRTLARLSCHMSNVQVRTRPGPGVLLPYVERPGAHASRCTRVQVCSCRMSYVQVHNDWMLPLHCQNSCSCAQLLCSNARCAKYFRISMRSMALEGIHATATARDIAGILNDCKCELHVAVPVAAATQVFEANLKDTQRGFNWRDTVKT